MLFPADGARVIRDVRVLPLSRWATTATWLGVALVSGTLLWMLKAGAWLDAHGGILAIASWNGHHILVAIAAALILGVLLTLAPLTGGFTSATHVQAAVLSGTGCVALIVMGGVLALALPILIVALLLVWSS